MLCPAALRVCCFQKLPLCSQINSCWSSMLVKSKKSQESKQARVIEPRDHAGVHVPFYIPSLSTLLQSQECSPVNICILPLESVFCCVGLCCLLLTCCLVSVNCHCHPFQPAISTFQSRFRCSENWKVQSPPQLLGSGTFPPQQWICCNW